MGAIVDTKENGMRCRTALGIVTGFSCELLPQGTPSMRTICGTRSGGYGANCRGKNEPNQAVEATAFPPGSATSVPASMFRWRLISGA